MAAAVIELSLRLSLSLSIYIYIYIYHTHTHTHTHARNKQVSVAVLLDNFISAAARIEFDERLQLAERRHREQACPLSR